MNKWNAGDFQGSETSLQDTEIVDIGQCGFSETHRTALHRECTLMQMMDLVNNNCVNIGSSIVTNAAHQWERLIIGQTVQEGGGRDIWKLCTFCPILLYI